PPPSPLFPYTTLFRSAALRVPEVLGEVLEALSLRPTVIDVGLDYHVGTAGSRLSPAQRQRTAIARALLKRPDVLILNEATTALRSEEHTSELQSPCNL